ncbi:MAG TPA: molybdenum cofactor guanylyltransferase [Gemmatimonadales bacterium]|nr:molybdenum cofactor guanylyltransferase [Gemmatimonadales bacterium]
MRGAVLAGGTASRFDGKPKGLERVGDERIVDRVVRAVESATGSPPVLIANAPGAATWCPGLKVIPDILPGRGSLGGIYTAVMAGEGPVLLVAWDMPFVPVALLQALVAGADGYDVFLPESGGKRGLEPLCGVYGPGCAAAIRDRLDQEDYRAIGFHERVRVGTLALADVSAHGAPEQLFFNVNTAQDLAEAEGMWQRRA